MHRRLQFSMRENPASHRRHASRFEVESLSNGTRTEKASVASEELAPVHVHSPAAGHGTVNAVPPHVATRGERDNAARHSAVFVGPRLPGNALHGFEPLIGSCEAAKLLGNIHVKTLQRYARHRRVRMVRLFRSAQSFSDIWRKRYLKGPRLLHGIVAG